MSAVLTAIASVSPRTAVPGPDGFTVRPATEIDAKALGRLYFDSYPPGVAVDSLDEAIADIEASFRGDYGELWPAASPVLVVDDDPVAAVMTVKRAPWGDTPDHPFIIEVFVHPTQRRKGLARHLLDRVFATVAEAGETAVALRVEPDNHPAVSLYRSLGFVVGEAAQAPIPGVDLVVSSPDDTEAAELIGELNQLLDSIYDPSMNHFGLEAAQVDGGRGIFILAKLDGVAAGCGALRLIDDQRAEVKRMYVRPTAQGRGLGRMILARLEEEAHRLGTARLVLEMGDQQPAAQGLYESVGFAPIPCWGEYLATPASVCLGKDL